ncbi:hypothetical protein NLG97_g988 [Lecanicillium saksenae]|uniref:Uncharacterized protein n=1 Tax=Lecanicillium saksenae TaxID=468837 RepID=A0ACC1R8E5_9HYPO|nr:hypothetical protein NLG97_g988 [Lecanicillium saksenae]
MASYQIQGKVAIVTGAGSGIGHALAKLLLQAGCSVVFADLKLRPEAAQTFDNYSKHAPSSNSPTAFFQPTDVTNWAQLSSLWEAAIGRFERVDIVASVAGIYEPPMSSFWRPPGVHSDCCDSENADMGQYLTFAVNQIAPIRLAQIAIDYWTQHREIQGNYIAVASIAAYLHSIETPLYMASKAALISFVKSLGAVQDIFGIRMAAVCPGPVMTPMFEPEWNRKLTTDDTYLTEDECASVIVRVLQEPGWGNGSVVETQRLGDKEKAEVVVRDVHLEKLYPLDFARPSKLVIESREKLIERIRLHGMR